MNSFKRIEGLHVKTAIESHHDTFEIVNYLQKNKKVEELKVLTYLLDYVEHLVLTMRPDSSRYNKALIDAVLLFEKIFNIKDDFQKSFYALIFTLIEKANAAHKQMYSKDANLFTISPSIMEYMRCYVYMKMGRFVYFDKNIFVGFRPCLKNLPDELFVFVKNGSYYSFNSVANTKSKISITSVKKAKKAIQAWKGELKVGFSHTHASLRLCKMLGLDVNTENGEVRLYRQKGIGF